MINNYKEKKGSVGGICFEEKLFSEEDLEYNTLFYTEVNRIEI